MKRLRVLLADDHKIVGKGLRGLLEPEFEGMFERLLGNEVEVKLWVFVEAASRMCHSATLMRHVQLP